MCTIFCFYLFSSWGNFPLQSYWSLSCNHGLHCSDYLMWEQQQQDVQDGPNLRNNSVRNRGSLFLGRYSYVRKKTSRNRAQRRAPYATLDVNVTTDIYCYLYPNGPSIFVQNGTCLKNSLCSRLVRQKGFSPDQNRCCVLAVPYPTVLSVPTPIPRPVSYTHLTLPTICSV